MEKTAPIGVFDSGMGGISVLGELQRHMPTENYIYYGDSANAPYGAKSAEELIELSIQVSDYLVSQGVKAIVIACNTATSAAVQVLRAKYDIPIIGMEPALKPAVEGTENGRVAVMATEVTLREKKFSRLMENLIQPAPLRRFHVRTWCPCGRRFVCGDKIEMAIRRCFADVNIEEVTSVVLGCTHFVFLKESVKTVLGDNIKIYDGNFGTVRHLRNKLMKLGQLNMENDRAEIKIINSLSQEMVLRSSELLKMYV